jgi:hypothetical protein
MKNPRITFFCELDATVLQALFTLPDLVTLGELNAGISLGILDLSAERAEVVRRLNEASIPVVAWLHLPKAGEPWQNLESCQEAIQCYRNFQTWTAQYNLQWEGVGLDFEPNLAIVQEIMDLKANHLRLLKNLAGRAYNIRKYSQTRKTYRALVAQIQADGYQVESYQFPIVVDERRFPSSTLQRLIGILDIPVDKEVLLLYSSFVRPYGSGVIWSYGQRAQSIAVGSTGGGVVTRGERSLLETSPLTWEELVRDLRLAWVYTDDIYVYSLEGCVRQGYLNRLKTFEWDQPILEPVEAAVQVDAWRQTLGSALWIIAHPLVVVTGFLGILLFLRWLRRLRR